MTDTPINLDEIEARANKATPEPWDVCSGHLVRAIKGDLAAPLFTSEAPIDWHKKKNVTHAVLCRAYADEVNNADFIAHARTDIPTLIAEVRRLRAQASAAGAEISRLHEVLSCIRH